LRQGLAFLPSLEQYAGKKGGVMIVNKINKNTSDAQLAWVVRRFAEANPHFQARVFGQLNSGDTDQIMAAGKGLFGLIQETLGSQELKTFAKELFGPLEIDFASRATDPETKLSEFFRDHLKKDGNTYKVCCLAAV